MRSGGMIALTCSGIFLIAVLFLFSGGNSGNRSDPDDPERPEPVFEVMKRIRDVTPDNIVQPPEIEGETVERLPAVIAPPPPPKPPEPETWPRPVVLAAGVIRSGDRTIELAGIEPVDLDETCGEPGQRQWPCGMLARTEMRMFVRGRPIECDPVEEDATGPVTTRCRLASFDMSAWLVQNGWAHPRDGLFEAELEEAKAEKRGIWSER